MKEGWTYKKLVDLCTIRTGKRDANHAKEDGAYRFYTCAAQYVYCDTYSFDGDCLILPGNGANVGDVYMYSGKFDAYQRTYVLSNINREEIYFKYLYYFFLGNWRRKGTANQYGTATNYIIMSNFTGFTIGYPTLSEQQHIAEELDLLSSIIEKKKAQLNELDNMSQSLFYEMFGDPITNDKGWEVKKLSEVCKLFAGGDVPKERFSKIKTEEYQVPIYSNGVEEHGLYGYTDIPKVTDKCITISGRGTIGHVEKRCEAFYPIIRLLVVIPIIPMDISYLTYLATIKEFKGNGGAIPQLTVPMIKDTLCPLPPLDLQNQFASKIETIEHQKELIKMSISEVEILFNSRMDLWFNK